MSYSREGGSKRAYEVISMNATERKTLLELLAEIPDHRKGNTIKHNLSDILTTGILAIMCNADTFTGMQLFGETHKDALSEILELPHGIPSHDAGQQHLLFIVKQDIQEDVWV